MFLTPRLLHWATLWAEGPMKASFLRLSPNGSVDPSTMETRKDQPKAMRGWGQKFCPISQIRQAQTLHSDLQGGRGPTYPCSKLPPGCLARRRNKSSSSATTAQTGLATSLPVLGGGTEGGDYPKPPKKQGGGVRYWHDCSGGWCAAMREVTNIML